MGVPTDASTALFFALNRSVESTALACQSLTAELGWTVGDRNDSARAITSSMHI